jgi:hypothetical protein
MSSTFNRRRRSREGPVLEGVVHRILVPNRHLERNGYAEKSRIAERFGNLKHYNIKK